MGMVRYITMATISRTRRNMDTGFSHSGRNKNGYGKIVNMVFVLKEIKKMGTGRYITMAIVSSYGR